MSVFTGAGSPFNTGLIKSLLLRDLWRVNASQQLLPNKYERVFKPEKADMSEMIENEVRDLTWGQQTEEGGTPPTALASQGIQTVYPIMTYTNYFSTTLPAQQDNLYKDKWTPQSEGFVKSQNVLRSMALWGFLNNATNEKSMLGDGLPFFSTQHVFAEGTFSNTYPNPVSVSKDSLSYSANAISLYTSYAGYPKQLVAKSLETSVPQSQLCQTLLFSPNDPTSANRRINALFSGGYYEEGLFANPYINDNTFYLARSNEDMSFKHFKYMAFQVHALPVSYNFILGFASIERFGYGCGSARAGHGSTMY